MDLPIRTDLHKKEHINEFFQTIFCGRQNCIDFTKYLIKSVSLRPYSQKSTILPIKNSYYFTLFHLFFPTKMISLAIHTSCSIKKNVLGLPLSFIGKFSEFNHISSLLYYEMYVQKQVLIVFKIGLNRTNVLGNAICNAYDGFNQ